MFFGVLFGLGTLAVFTTIEINTVSSAVFISITLVSRFLICLSRLIRNFQFFLVVMAILLVASRSVETNPGPYLGKHKNTLKFAMWNLDSLPARGFSRIPVIESLQSVHDFDLFGICESSLHEHISKDDLFIHGFSPDPYRADRPLNTHNGGVCLYFKENVPSKRRKDLEFINETIVVEILQKNNKKLFFVLSYRHPNRSLDDTNLYFSCLNRIIENISNENPVGIILSGDFNTRSSYFW